MGDGPFTDAMHVKKNKYVEEWNGRREITEKAFKVDPNSLPAILLFCVAIPYSLYALTRRELIIKGDPRYKNSGLASRPAGCLFSREVPVLYALWLPDQPSMLDAFRTSPLPRDLC